MAELVERLRSALAGRYLVEEELGEGGMALVFAARDLRHPRRVALKVLKPDVAQTVGAERFLREIEIEAGLQHPHILPLLDSDVAAGLPFYVMPFVEGESLRDRLRREVQLPVDDALRIAGQVADALDFAHSRDVVHRDVKPDNILLAGDHVYVADFGVARAAQAAGGDWQVSAGTAVWRTETGVAIGTLGYMSPEQATAAPRLDGRSDQYGLACVVYEMLAGETPFDGPTLHAIVAKLLTLPPPSVRVVREIVPGVMDHAIRRALARTPADRFRTCGEFVSALRRRPSVADRIKDAAGARVARRSLVVAGAATVIVLAVARGGSGDGAPVVDTTRYAILPFQHDAGVDPVAGESWLHDALQRWTGISVVPRLDVDQALDRHRPRDTQSRIEAVAREEGAGRYIQVSVSPVGDSLRIHAALYDAVARGPPLADHSVRLPRDLGRADLAFNALADRLLFRGDPPDRAPGTDGTRSLPAAQAFVRGQEGLEAWDLARADSAFSLAAHLDPGYPQAHLWTAVVRSWRGQAPTTWRVAAEQAALGRDRLSLTDQTLEAPVLAQLRGDLPRACALWESLATAKPHDGLAWYGWARCQETDSTVIADPRSPSGWSFRTSYHRLLIAYERAFELRPAILGGYRASAGRLEPLLFIRGNAWRSGRALPPDTTVFRADPSWQGDSLAFVPRPRHLITSRQYTASTTALNDAVRHQRQRYGRVAQAWAEAAPADPRALETLANALALLGDAAALDTLRRARRLVRGSVEALRLAGADVWMHVAFGVPFHRQRLELARALADSLLRTHPPGGPADPRTLAGLATLTGRARAAAAYARDPRAGDALRVPPSMRPDAQVLLIYSALGGPSDSLAALERDVRASIDRLPSGEERERATNAWLVRSATLAFTTRRFESLSALAGRDNYLLEFQLNWMAHDTAAVRRGLDELRESRRLFSPELLTLDGLCPEAELLAALGDTRAAAEWLDPTLRALSRKPIRELGDPVRAASLVRAMALRAHLADLLGDRDDAARWGGAVLILWSDADPFLRERLERLRRMADDE